MKDDSLDRNTIKSCLTVLERLQEHKHYLPEESHALRQLQNHLRRLDACLDIDGSDSLEKDLDDSAKSILESFRERPRQSPLLTSSSTLERSIMLGNSSSLPFPNLNSAGTNNAELSQLMSQFESLENFDVFKLAKLTEDRPLEAVTLTLLHRYNLCDKLSLPVNKVASYLQVVEDSYKDNNPYHNATHAADVVQALAWLLSGDSFTRQLTDLELLCIIIAAAVHDVGHPGVRNDFLVNLGTDAAVRYNDNSVNENGHAAMAFELLYNPKHNFVAHLRADERHFFRRTVCDIILGTDMSQHDNHLKNFKGKVQEYGTNIGQWPLEARDVLLQYLMHAADISNPLRPSALSSSWSKRIMEEFMLQGDRERAMGMPVSPLCDRETTDWKKSQLVFLECVVRPVFESLVPLAPNGASHALSSIEFSRSSWQSGSLSRPSSELSLPNDSPAQPSVIMDKVPSSSIFALEDVH
ncbi:hypothetical protein WJX73_005831 [Symbiochloris irregularis]|uniref:Phosphodiesterase n=1 Tax=Symbiochloris irregularis TaxID=706552 RepID=A0AAW1Q058_9CHLO